MTVVVAVYVTLAVPLLYHRAIRLVSVALIVIVILLVAYVVFDGDNTLIAGTIESTKNVTFVAF